MLSSDLLLSRISKGKIHPIYAKLEPETLELAELLIESFKRHVGRPYGELTEELEGFEGMNFRFIRGLSQLLTRRAEIKTVSAVEPSLAREALFEACGGLALTFAERKAALNKAAKSFSISVPELEKALWADLEEKQILTEFQTLLPTELLGQYNISLTQTLLFRAVDMDLQVKGNYQQLLRTIVRTKLMYTLENSGNEETVKLHLEGPASLFRMSDRYGTALAKVFPVLLNCERWSLRAGILYKGYRGKRILEFTLEDRAEVFRPLSGSKVLESLGKAKETKESYGIKALESPGKIKESERKEKTEYNFSGKEIYDSEVEKEFAALGFGRWKTRREPTILKAGPYAFVPDFSLERDGVLVYVEIVGFWTPEYLEKKIGKLKQVQENVLLLVNKKLSCSEKAFPGRQVLFYEKKLPAREIMQFLRKTEKKKLQKDLKKLQGAKLEFSGELVRLEELAERKGVWIEALREEFSKRSLEYNSAEYPSLNGYVLLEDFALQQSLLEKLDSQLKKLRSYAEALKVFEKFKLDSELYYPVLDFLGYKVIWCGLSEETAKLKKEL